MFDIEKDFVSNKKKFDAIDLLRSSAVAKFDAVQVGHTLWSSILLLFMLLNLT